MAKKLKKNQPKALILIWTMKSLLVLKTLPEIEPKKKKQKEDNN